MLQAVPPEFALSRTLSAAGHAMRASKSMDAQMKFVVSAFDQVMHKQDTLMHEMKLINTRLDKLEQLSRKVLTVVCYEVFYFHFF